MKKIFTAFIIILVLIGGYAYLHRDTQPDETSLGEKSSEEAAIRNTVTSFGAALQKVSLLAPLPDRMAAMESAYGAYVEPELLSKWYSGDSNALGRTTSSPWPDRIEITSITKTEDTYTVAGNVIEVTSVELQNGTAAASYPVTLTLEQRNGQWLITEAVKGPYASADRVMSIESYVSAHIRDLSPVKETVGGTFYVTDIEAHGGAGTVSYEDGHNAYVADFTYSIDEQMGITINSFIIRA